VVLYQVRREEREVGRMEVGQKHWRSNAEETVSIGFSELLCVMIGADCERVYVLEFGIYDGVIGVAHLRKTGNEGAE
jgi:hypothetical protein